jgi:lysophospholipase L1-like esterase
MRPLSFLPVIFPLVLLASFLSVPHQCLAESDEITDHYRRMMVYHEYMDGNVPEDAVVFIGDSITQGLCVSAVAPRAINYGIGSDTTFGVLKRMPKYKSLEKCGAVVFAIGVNDLARRSNEDIVDNWKLISERVPENTPVLFSAILPMDLSQKEGKSMSNERIIELNGALEKLCAEKGHAFVDAGPQLRNDQGDLDAAFHTGDGVHLNTAGYERWIAVLKEGLQSLGK